MANDWQTTDYFFDESLVEDPYPYYDELRSACPVQSLDHLGVVAVTGYDEALEVYRDTESFSSCNSVIGPFATFPVPLEGDDVTDIAGFDEKAGYMYFRASPDNAGQRYLYRSRLDGSGTPDAIAAAAAESPCAAWRSDASIAHVRAY